MKKLNTIGLMSALPEETHEIEKLIQNPKRVISPIGDVILGKIYDNSVALIISGMGKVNSSITAQILISNFGAEAIIFCGVAGGISPELGIGDVVLAEQTFQHDYGFLGEQFTLHPVGRLPEIGMNDQSLKLNVIHSDSWFYKHSIEVLSNSDEWLQSVPVGNQNRKPKFKTGIVATGDQFIANSKKSAELVALGAIAVEMEGGAVGVVAQKNKIPCIILRAISDTASAHAPIDFSKFLPVVARNNATAVSKILKI